MFVHYFVDGVKPLWEDEQCKDGGRWTVRCPKHLAGKVWEDLCMTLIGEQFGCEKKVAEVLGLVLATKMGKWDVISVWHRTSSDAESKEKIRAGLEKVCLQAFEDSKAMVEKLKMIEDEDQRQQFGFTPYLAPTFKFQFEYDNFLEIQNKPAPAKSEWRGRGGRGGFSRGGGRGGQAGKGDAEGFMMRSNATRGGIEK